MRCVALFPHKPSRETQAYIRSLPGEWTLYHYALSIEPGAFHTIPEAVEACVRRISEKTPLASCGRVIVVPPGLSAAVDMFYEALRGVSGLRPETLLSIRAGESYKPCPERPIIYGQDLYNLFRKERSHEGIVA
jgi:hypothetical protein